MAKSYELLESDVADEQKTIVVSETKSVTNEERVTVAQLKEQHAQKIEQSERLKKEADAIVDQLQAINDNTNLDIEVKDIPVKLNK
jgi:hypothetical protein